MNAALRQTPGARLRAVRDALNLRQEDLARLLGETAYPVQIGRYETNKAPIPQELIERLAEVYSVPRDLIHGADQIDRLRQAMEIDGYILSPTQVLDPASPAVVGFIAEDSSRIWPVRIAVVFAPMIGEKQIEACLKILCKVSGERTSSAMLVSEAEPTPEAAGKHGTVVKGVELRVVRFAELETARLPLTLIANAILRATTSSRVRPLIPHLMRDDEPGLVLPADAAFDCWRRNALHPSHLLLVGEPGSGKTMTLLRWARLLAQEHLQAPLTNPCPIYVQLWSWWDATNFHRRLVQTILDQLPHASQPRVEQAVGQGRFILLLDGLDELVGPDPTRLLFVERALDPLLRLRCRAVLTARSTVLYPKDRGALEDLGGALRARLPVSVARLQRLEPAAVHAFLGSQRSDGGRALLEVVHQQGLSELARLPYMLDVLADDNATSPSALAAGRPLMSRLLAPTYRRWVENDAPYFGADSSELWTCFAQIAAELRRRAVSALQISDLPPRFEAVLRTRGEARCGRPQPSSRIISIDHDAVRFVHRQIERFFFASWVVDQVRLDRPEGLTHMWLSHDDILLLAGMLRERSVTEILTRWVSDPRQDTNLRDLAAYAVGFAGSTDALAELRRVASEADSRSLRETAGFATMVLEDEGALGRCFADARSAARPRDRASARAQLLSLDMHGSLITPHVRAAARAVLQEVASNELAADLLGLLHQEEEATTTRSAAAVALGYLGVDAAQAALASMLDRFVSQGPLERGRRELRLAMAVRAGLEWLSMGGGTSMFSDSAGDC